MKKSNQYKISDYTNTYRDNIKFNKNKSTFIHQWYPFVEGYSKEFITGIIDELDYKPELALDPFSGSGTTPLGLQELGISCYSCEVNPFLHKLAKVKLERNYLKTDFKSSLSTVEKILEGELLPIRDLLSPPEARTFQPREGRDKWIFDKAVMDGVLDIKHAINQVSNPIYRELFRVALASKLLDISNAYRDGKSLKYKKNWEDTKLERRDVHNIFLDRLDTTFLPDIEKFGSGDFEVENKDLCLYGDTLKIISQIPDNSIDLIITSPPYLNSRDYTDIYIAELWMLDLVKNYKELRSLRENTLRSHVQVRHGEVKIVDSNELKNVVSELEENQEEHWNSELLGMIKGYFADMDSLFDSLSTKMKPGKKVFFNVANSAYYGVKIKVDEIIAEIARNYGFEVNEIRKARELSPSSQQKDQISSLRESVIVLTSR